MLQARQPNSLPVPSGAWLQAVKDQVTEQLQASTSPLQPLQPQQQFKIEPIPQAIFDINDNFPKGQIVRFFPYQGYGFMRGKHGREIYFNISELDFVGTKGKEALAIGTPVGYDVSHTSHGLHVKKLKIY